MPKNKHLPPVGGVVTLYNSDDSLVENIRTYSHQVGRLYVVDNSETPNDQLVARLVAVSPTVVYLKNGENLGLGVALNRAAQRAIADGFTHLLMMDDDSSMADGAVAQLYATAVADPAVKIGIVAARQTDVSGRKRTANQSDQPPTVVLTAITAGSLLNLAAYQAVGPFQDDLFIDWVDLEYSFRLRRHGYQIRLDSQAHITHRIGVRKQVRLLGLIPYRWRSHSPARLYYKFRNSLFVMQREGDNIPSDFRRRFRKELYRNVVRILLAEPNKKEFFTLIRRAIRDARKGQLGKLT